MKVQRKYFWLLFIVFSSVSLVITYTAYTLANSILINKYRELCSSEMRYMLTICETELDQLNDIFRFLNSESDFEELDEKKSIHQRLQVVKHMNDIMAAVNTFDLMRHIQNIVRQNSSGYQYWYGNGNNLFEKEKIIELIHQLDKRQTTLSYVQIKDSIFTTKTTKKVLQFAQYTDPIRKEKGGFLYFELDIDYLKEVLGSYQPTVKSEIHLIDNKDNILYTNTNNKVGEKLKFSAGKDSIEIQEPLSRYGWNIIIRASKKQITEDNQIIFNTILFIAIVSIVIEMIIIFLLMKRLFYPIKMLSNGLAKLSNGNFETTLDICQRDEIGEACKNFNILSKTLKQTIENEINYQLKLKDSQYKALQSQINPHFVYNALNTLKWMANIQKSQSIKDMVDSLWKLFKIVSHREGQFVTIREEMELIEAYTYIQNVRYKHKFTIEQQIGEDIEEVIIPQFILEPFVENAIFHGIEPKKGPGKIKIKGYYKQLDIKSNQVLIIEIIDDGVGMSSQKLEEIMQYKKTESSGRGMNNLAIYNVRERLKLLYARSDLLQITSDIGKGTRVKIILPTYIKRNK